MVLESYFYTILSSILLAPIGILFFKNFPIDIILKIFFGILIAALIASFTSRFIPSYTREILLLLSVSSILIIYIKKIPLIDSFNKNWYVSAISFTLFFIFSSLFLHDLNPYYYRFEAHDIHIFGPTIEIFNSNYFGNIKNPISFPNELSSYHTLPGIFIGTASFINPSINLITLISSKYLLLSFFLASFFSDGFLKVKKKYMYLFSLITILYFFKESFYYSLSISSYLYALILIVLAKLSIKNDRKFLPIIFCVLVSLTAIKIPIYYAVLPSLVYLLLFLKKSILRIESILFCYFVFLSLLGIALIPISDDVSGIVSYSLMNPFILDDLKSLAGIWFVELRHFSSLMFFLDHDLTIQILGYPVKDLTQLLIKIIFIIFFYFAFLVFCLRKIEDSIIQKSLLIYLATSLLGVFFIRNNGNMDLQNHLYFLMPFLIIYYFPFYLAELPSRMNRTLSCFLLVIISFNIFDLALYKPTLAGSSLDYRDTNSIHYSEIDFDFNHSLKDRYIINKDTPFWYHEINSQLIGKRIYKEDLKKFEIDTKDSFLIKYSILEK